MSTPIDRGFAPVVGTTLYYERAGQGAPVVLLPGFALDTRLWADQAAALAPHCHVVCCDLRGFGRSALPGPEPYAHTADLRALLDHFAFERVAVVGLSRGGRWALQFALDFPARVAALVVADAVPDGYRSEAAGPARSPAVVRATGQGVAAARAAWLEHPLFETARRRPEVRARLAEMIGAYSGWHWYHPDLAVSSQPPAAERLAQIQAPTLIVIGEHDAAEYQAAAGQMAHEIPGARRAVIPNAGHLSNLENPAAFNAALLAFLGEALSLPCRAAAQP